MSSAATHVGRFPRNTGESHMALEEIVLRTTNGNANEPRLPNSPGRGGMFSLEGEEALRFLICSRLFTDDEHAALESAGRV